jgi:hypothetical protein
METGTFKTTNEQGELLRMKFTAASKDGKLSCIILTTTKGAKYGHYAAVEIYAFSGQECESIR